MSAVRPYLGRPQSTVPCGHGLRSIPGGGYRPPTVCGDHGDSRS